MARIGRAFVAVGDGQGRYLGTYLTGEGERRQAQDIIGRFDYRCRLSRPPRLINMGVATTDIHSERNNRKFGISAVDSHGYEIVKRKHKDTIFRQSIQRGMQANFSGSKGV